MTYDVESAVNRLLDSDESDLDVLCKQFAGDVPSRELRSVLEIVARPLLREYISRRRMSNPLLHGTVRTTTGRSWKVAAHQERAAALRDRVHCGSRVFKFLGDMNYDDLMFAAQERQAKAEGIAAMAKRYREIAKQLHTYGVRYVRDLPPEAFDLE